MMAADWLSKRHDTKRVLETNIGPLTPELVQTLTDIQNGEAGASLLFVAQPADASGTKPSGSAAKVRKPATVVNPATGHLRYQPVADDVDTSDTYCVEWPVTGVDGRPDTYPTDGYDVWQIVDDLDNAP